MQVTGRLWPVFLFAECLSAGLEDRVLDTVFFIVRIIFVIYNYTVFLGFQDKEGLMKIEIKESDNEILVKVWGSIDSNTASELDRVLNMIKAETEKIVIDCKELDYISSVGLRKLLQMKKALENNAEIYMMDANEAVVDIIATTGFDRYLKLCMAGKETDSLSIKDLFAAQVKKYGSKIFLVSDRAYSFEDIDKSSQMLARRLFLEGVHKGSHVGLYGVNSADWLAAFFAIQKCGAIALPLNHNNSIEELATFSEIGDITHLCVGDGKETGDIEGFKTSVMSAAGSVIKSVIDIRGAVGSKIKEDEYEAVAGQFSEPVDIEDDCIMLFTSGSTGRSKAVLHSSYSMLHSAKCAVDICRLTDEDSVCMNVPFSHTLGLVRCFLASLLAGARLEIPKDVSPSALISFVNERKCTVMHAIPTSMVSLVNDPDFSPEKLSSIRCSILVGAPVTETQMRMLMEKLPNDNFISSYGMSELSPITMTEYGDSVEHICRTVGRLCDGVEVGIFDLETGKLLDKESGKKGEIAVRGTSAMTAYYKVDPAIQAIDRDGWIKTGDFGFFDADGYMYLGGRMKELIHSLGHTIEPNEVGSVISTYPAIAQVKVLGVLDKECGEIVVACITKKNGVEFKRDELDAMLKEKLESYKIPRVILLYDALPTLANGKIDAVSLKADAAKRVEEEGA